MINHVSVRTRYAGVTAGTRSEAAQDHRDGERRRRERDAERREQIASAARWETDEDGRLVGVDVSA